MNGTDPSLNGDAVPEVKVKPKRKRKKLESVEARASAPPASAPEPDTRGRLASELRPQFISWLARPWIPKGVLSMVIGLPNVGKSTFMAWLIAQAGNVCILPGYEEVPETTTLPRLVAAGVKLNLVRFLDDRPYTLPRDKSRIANIISGWEGQLLVIDPIDSYMDDQMNENNGKDVRAFLESAAWIAKETGCAVVGVRHPGKDRVNVLPGSRQWRAVPRMIIELLTDGSTPPRKIIRHFRDYLGQDIRPREFLLLGERGQPRVFKLQQEVADELHEFGASDSDPTSRNKVKLAGQVLRHMMTTETECYAEDYMARLQAQGIGTAAGYAARKHCGVFSIPSGSGAKWAMKRKDGPWPKWTDLDTK